MKNKIILCLLLLALGFQQKSMAQPQILYTSFDGSACPYLECTFNWLDNNNCVPRWAASHGTPTIMTNEDAELVPDSYDPDGSLSNLNIFGRAMWMCSYGCNPNGEGEGGFADYYFKRGHCYEISFIVSAQSADYGVLNIFAANGLTGVTSPDFDCLGDVPETDSELIVAQNLSYYHDDPYAYWTNVSITYTPTVDFSQFWIYPEGARAIVDGVRIRESCPTVLEFFDPATDIPANNYEVSETITVGTSGAIGGSTSLFVDSDPNGNTQFIAEETITLLPNTYIKQPAASKSFFMQVAPVDCTPSEYCGTGHDERLIDDGIGRGIATTHRIENVIDDDQEHYKEPVIRQRSDENFEVQNELNIYPNPNNGQFTLSIPKIGTNGAEIMIYSQVGTIVYKTRMTNTAKNLDLSHLPPGLYMINVNLGHSVSTERLIIQ